MIGSRSYKKWATTTNQGGNTYHKGSGWTATVTDEYSFSPARITKMTGYTLINRSVTCTFTATAYNPATGSWETLGTHNRSSSGSWTWTVNSDTLYTKCRISHKNANWSRDDGNSVHSIEPFKVYYQVYKGKVIADLKVA